MGNSGESEQAIISTKKELWVNSKKSITLLRNVARSHSVCNLSTPLNYSQ